MRKIKITEGIWLTIIPAAIYAFTFSYESGYLSFFGIPSAFVSIGVSEIYPALLFFLLQLFVITFWLSVSVDGSENQSSSARIVSILMLYIGLYPMIYYVTKGQDYMAAILITATLAMLLIGVLSWLESRFETFRNISKKIYEKLEGALPDSSIEDDSSAVSRHRSISAGIVLLLMPLFLAYSAGKNNAQKEVEFSTITSSESGNLILVRIYDSSVIMVPYDPVSMKVDGTYYVAELSDLKGKPISVKSIGPLVYEE